MYTDRDRLTHYIRVNYASHPPVLGEEVPPAPLLSIIAASAPSQREGGNNVDPHPESNIPWAGMLSPEPWCIYVYMCTYNEVIYLYMYTCIYVYMYMYTCKYVYMFMCIYVHMYIWTYVHIPLSSLYINIYIPVYTDVRLMYIHTGVNKEYLMWLDETTTLT